MPANPKSDPNELDGRTKLLRSRPEPDNILVFGIATLIGLFFSFMAFYFVISEIIEIGWQGLDGFGPFLKLFIQAFIICGIPIAYTLMVLDMLIWQIKGEELVTYSEKDLLIQHKSLFSGEWRIPWDCILEVKAYSYPWYKFKGRDGDETLCLTYKNAKDKTKKVRFGLLLNEDQQEFVVERIKELCVEKF
ncbi:MAG: hypothetical protein IKZ54_06010 [Bacteroidales bacterium]|nr:hypothetical protein [Bacteroidales bacterium]